MRENFWTNTKTNTEISITGALGSPGAWLRRAYNVANLDDTTFKEGTLTPTEISVAGIWYRPVALPDTENHRVLYRFFNLAAPEQLSRRSAAEQFPAIGIAMAVPFHQVLQWQRQFRNSGAAYIWWNTPVNRAVRATEKPARRQLDHAVVYSMLDAGKTKKEIAKQLNFPLENVSYVVKKWTAGLPLYANFAKPRIDAAQVYRDHLAGANPKELADKYVTAVAYVYRLIGQQKELQCLDPSPLYS